MRYHDLTGEGCDGAKDQDRAKFCYSAIGAIRGETVDRFENTRNGWQDEVGKSTAMTRGKRGYERGRSDD